MLADNGNSVVLSGITSVISVFSYYMKILSIGHFHNFFDNKTPFLDIRVEVVVKWILFFHTRFELKRFPTLQNDIATAANEALERFCEESRKTVLRLVEMESSYLMVDFFRKLHTEPAKKPEKNANPSGPNNDHFNDNYLRRIGSNVNAYIGMVCDTLKNTIPKAVVYCQVREAKRSLLSNFYAQVGKREKERLSAMLDEDPK
ncbi:hypothetical protein CRYUN_Cryun04dG0175400 [Craigia yunnanensis]